MASPSTFSTSGFTRIVTLGRAHCPVNPGNSQLRGAIPLHFRFPTHINLGAKNEDYSTIPFPVCSLKRSNGELSAKPRRKTGNTKLKKETVNREFAGTLQPLSGPAANFQERRHDIPSEANPVNDEGDKSQKDTSAQVQEAQQDTLDVPGDGKSGAFKQVLDISAEDVPSAGTEQVFSGRTEAEASQKEVLEVSLSADISAVVIEEEKVGDPVSWADTVVEGKTQKERVLEDEILKERELHELKERKLKEELRRSEILKQAVRQAYLKNKIFYFPTPALAGGELEIYMNRRITALIGQPKIFITGAFNEWRWKPFSVELSKTDLPGDGDETGDWWVCKIQVPEEAYKVDFIFYDGDSVYENNDKADFYIIVEGGMPKVDFEYFLLEEKALEARRLKEEEAERERIEAQRRELEEQRAGEEVDRALAKNIVNEARDKAGASLQKAVERIEGVWFTDPPEFGGGTVVTLYYNRASGPLAHSEQVWIHCGYDNWKDMVSIVQELEFDNKTGGDWWAAKVKVPEKAYMLNWVFADGPPESARVYDNNNYQDFHRIVAKTVAEDVYWAEVEEDEYATLQKERKARREAAVKKAAYVKELKETMKAKTMETFLRAQSHIFYTEPAQLVAGEDVTVFYNPSNTVLNGKPEVYMRGSFNRWTHFLGKFQPVKMERANNGTHLMATVKIPKDAYMLDLVFSERGDDEGGVYDNRNGLDYHVPVTGGLLTQPPLDIVHIAVEMAPIAKVGGLGDVVTSLSRAVQDAGHNVEVVVPKYDCLNYQHIHDLREVQAFHFGGTRVRVWNGKVEGLTVHFLEPENGMFWVGCIYGRRDDGARFGFFCHAALEFLRQSGKHVDILHCHDWSSAPVAWLFNEGYRLNNMHDARIVFSIHNLEFGAPLIGRAMANAHMATTVSPTYAREVSGNGVIAPHLHKFHGIINGIDPDIWDPYTDPFIPVAYNTENVTEGKRAAKEELRRQLGLRHDDRPILGIITRLTAQKGIHLIKHGIYRTLERGGQVVLLGSAPDPRVQNDFVNLSNQLNQSHGDMARLCLAYDEPLSHLIYAACDFILIPSIFEPCGLTQLTAMRYGAIPVVRKTGGLNDTVFDVDHDQDRAREQGLSVNGFSFEAADAAGLDYALNRAISAWYEARGWFEGLCRQVMEQDWTWNRPALDYIELYYGAKNKP